MTDFRDRLEAPVAQLNSD